MPTWPGPFVHAIDPVLFEAGGIYFWYYGLSYSVGFLGLFWWLRRSQLQLGIDRERVYELAIAVAAGVLLVGRAVEVLVYEWPHYRAHPHEVLYYWQGGMSSHGLLLGGCVGAWLFGRSRRRSFLEIADVLTVPAALLLALGRLGNFVDGQIVGSVTELRWGVKFPDADGFRHPVVLYEALKNLLLVPILLRAGARAPAAAGRRLGLFVLWYGALRIPVDVFREYPTTLLGVATGQWLNVATAALGAGILLALRGSVLRAGAVSGREVSHASGPCGLVGRRLAFVLLVIFPLVIPSDWTQDVPERYGKRHPIERSWLYRSTALGSR
jgi:phosphatidylglycerol:prolipoprotein diacylglycerol transferase